MIISFKSRDTAKVYARGRSRRLPAGVQRVALRKLKMLNNAQRLDDLRVPPANRLEKLRGNRSGQYSIRINERYRVCFIWCDGNALDVEIVDYH